jgi:DNA-binding CsgD family transcriptional regulator
VLNTPTTHPESAQASAGQLLAQFLAQLMAAPGDFSSLQDKMLSGLCRLVGAGGGVAHLSRNLQQGSEAKSIVSTGQAFDCSNDCHACTARVAMAASDGELIRSSVSHGKPGPSGSVVTRFGLAGNAMPKCAAPACGGASSACNTPTAYIYSLAYLPQTDCVRIGAISLYRGDGPSHPFTREDCSLVNEFHSKLGWLYNKSTADHQADLPLAPRLVRVLEQLLPGYSEKQVAAQLGYSPHTVHTYVKAIYKHFGVNSRSELLAKVLGGL